MTSIYVGNLAHSATEETFGRRSPNSAPWRP